MEEKIELLYQHIKEQGRRYMWYKEEFGLDNRLTNNTLQNIIGLQEAFEIIAGHSYTTHLINEIDAILNKIGG